VLVTGLRGTLGPKLAHALEARGATVIGWNRDAVPPDDHGAGRAFLERTEVDAVCHLALGSPAWAALLARHAWERGVPFLLTSTAMVFHHEPDGPHAPTDERTAKDDYGRLKVATEDAVRNAYGDAIVARIGWQIDADARGNNMLAHLDRTFASDGTLRASRRWRPACSFMQDTVEALVGLLERGRGGVHHLDSNAVEGHTFDAIVSALAERYGRTWRVETTEDYVHDQRLVDSRTQAPGDAPPREAMPHRMPHLSQRLPSLREAAAVVGARR
jgi:dTDP-4-dehydrorhamnose reductase